MAEPQFSSAAQAAFAAEPLQGLTKGLGLVQGQGGQGHVSVAAGLNSLANPSEPDPSGPAPATGQVLMRDVASLGWDILREDVSLPVAVLREARIEHNLLWMQAFIDRYGVKLAPHGKTTMSPALFQRQLAHGAWGITLATAPQVQAAFAYGVRRVIMANQLVGRGNMAIIAALQKEDAAFEFSCIVDSVANVQALGAYFQACGQRLRVLIEYGVPGGRTGVRDEAQEQAVLEAIRQWPTSLALVGVELYEGVLKEEADIRAFLQRVRASAARIGAAGGFAQPVPILTGAGSAWYDVVAEEFTSNDASHAFDVILRPGCYLTHDVGAYREANDRIQANNPVAREMRRSLLPALQVWAYVQSLPEPGKAIIALGKRDAAFDAGFPEASLHFRPQGPHGSADADANVNANTATHAPQAASPDWRITAMMDQHAFMSIPEVTDLQVGDMIAFDISHPCLTFDKWRQLLLVDEAYRVTGIVSTFF